MRSESMQLSIVMSSGCVACAYVRLSRLFSAFLGFGWAGLQLLVAGGPFLSRWLELEAFLICAGFSDICCHGFVLCDSGGVFAQMQASGSTSVQERSVRSHANKGTTFTILLFLLLASIAYLGMIKPV
jgi:hypothetical protein